jgi:uncharacterized membrane protein
MQQPEQPVELVEQVFHTHPREITDGQGRSFGTRAAGWVAAGAGSWAFIIAYLVFTAVYTLGHKAGILHFDPYPFQFYTFLVSVLAILLAQIILLFQNQQANIETRIAHNAYHQVAQINSVQATQLEILEQLQLMVTEIHALDTKIGGPVRPTEPQDVLEM